MDLKTLVPEYLGAMPQMIRVRAEFGLGGLPRGFHGIPKPMIAALNGWALAADFELTLAADIRIASERTRSGLVEARRGFRHRDGTILRPINACGTGVAAELVISAEPINARRAGYSKSTVRVIRYETSWRDLRRVGATMAPLR